MELSRRALEKMRRHRYLLLAAYTVPWLVAGQHARYPHGDWLWVELGARILVHHHSGGAIGGSPLHLYGTVNVVQIGPPALLLVAPSQWLPEQLGAHLDADVLSLLVLPLLWFAERAAAPLTARDLRGRLVFAGLVVVPVWTTAVQHWGHVDDALALLLAAAACMLVSRGQRAVLAGLLLGTAAASKPWIVVLLPLLLAFPRPLVGRSILAFVAGALVWWLPFVVADPGTVHALGSVDLLMRNHPTWTLVHLTGDARPWMRPLQLLGGIGLAAFVQRRWGWTAVPLVALSWRVVSDPYDWPYYVMGPLVAAALWDLARPARRIVARAPWATLSVAAAESWIPHLLPHQAAALRLVWFVGVLAVVAVASRRSASGSARAVSPPVHPSSELAPA